MTIYLFREPAGIDTGWHECSRDAYEAHKDHAGFEVMVVRDGVDEAVALVHFTEYFVRNYPGPHTIISDPYWHAPKIFRAAKYAIETVQGTHP